MKKILILLILTVTVSCSIERLHEFCDPEVATWKNGVIPFTFSDNMDSEKREILLQAIDHIERNTEVYFRQMTLDELLEAKYNGEIENGVLIKYTGAFQSMAGPPGVQGGIQDLRIGANINYTDAIHELGHVLGLPHEHQRKYRDLYVRVNFENIDPEWYGNFEVSEICFKTPYDFKSIMHYPAKSGDKIMLESIDGAEIKPSDTLTRLDISKIYELYP